MPAFELRRQLKRFGDDVLDLVQLLRRNNVGRKNVNHIPERPQQDSLSQIEIVQDGSQLGKIAGVIRVEFKRAHCADHANVRDSRMRFQGVQAFDMNFLNVRNSVKNGLRVEYLQVGDGRGATERVCRIRMAVKECAASIGGVKRFMNEVGTNSCTHGQ